MAAARSWRDGGRPRRVRLATVDEREVPLTGGNVSDGVVRVGDTVRRPAGPWTPAVHALLAHLHGVGFRGAPKPLGIDEHGREVLSFAPGRVVWPDAFDLVEPVERLARVGRLVRDFHDASAGFTPPPDARWQELIPPDRCDLVIHHDLAPWNLVIGDEYVLIDWDTAAPGSRLWDVAYALHGFVPLSAHPDWQQRDMAARVRVFADAYGLGEGDRRELLPLLARRTRSMHDFLREQAARGAQPWAGLWARGHGEVWRDDAEYIERRAAQWERALLS
ncbi:MAG: phosphotransferase [Nonomuraea sp.]|nr:phosphotransferase [Nonomuraea sp.]